MSRKKTWREKLDGVSGLPGISVVISARAAEESAALGDGEITPYRRALKAGGQLLPI